MTKLCNVTIFRVSGLREEYEIPKRGLLDKVHELIGAKVCDSVNLRNGKVMIVDDTGYLDGKPINPEGTQLYYQKCGGVTPNSIHGDVAICTDKDFA